MRKTNVENTKLTVSECVYCNSQINYNIKIEFGYLNNFNYLETGTICSVGHLREEIHSRIGKLSSK